MLTITAKRISWVEQTDGLAMEKLLGAIYPSLALLMAILEL
jgi:hypothetical protein